MATVSAIVVGASLVVYDQWIMRPRMLVGTVDLSEIYRAKEAQFTQLLTAGKGEEEREQALALARSFAQRLPQALEELPRECGCLVIVRAAMLGSPHARDLTPALRHKVGLP
jgi:hypothetical protein